MDLRAVKQATKPELLAAAAAAARNSGDLVRDAEILAQAHRTARAYSLAALAVEEVGKTIALAGLAGMPEALKARAPVGRMLEWHQLKQASGQFVAVVPYGRHGLAPTLLDMPEDDLAQILCSLKVPAEEADRLKRVGLYVDVGRGSQILEPTEVTEAEAARQLARARQAADGVQILLEPDEQARVAHPPAEEIELLRAVVKVLTDAGDAHTPDAAADAVTKMISMLRERLTGTALLGPLAAA